MYRRNFLLFAGIAAVPYLFLVLTLLGFGVMAGASIPIFSPPGRHAPISPQALVAVGGGFFIAFVVFASVFFIAAGAAIFAVSEIYSGRQATIRGCLRLALGRPWSILAVMFLTILLSMLGAIFLIIPGIYIACRLSVATAATLIDEIGPVDAIRRSFALTKGFALRAFVIILLTVALSYAALLLFQLPFGALMALSAKNTTMAMVWMGFMQAGNFIGGILVAPISTIGFAVFYYDLRVRKEAFDLQMMMKAIGSDPTPPAIAGGAPSLSGNDAT
jgi:hypothetical protein